ncbi:response regulator [Wenxinia saemankumensis]|uniref:Response regulator receiver domain-containing protein n=1 Tax=Wenxinia saemankumensis TaxID=1447782 RepID=A0A1M6ANH3_9RHOB|nr:response regulator [Wenxinia saemankumensis]SHI37947.1 Response regulator receiver domain-containing protein [Wenxinia saemankumensis]
MMKVLVVDDEALIALDMVGIVEMAGHSVLGPAFSLDAGFSLLETEVPDVALLDIDVGGRLVWPLARRLVDMGAVPVFISANSAHPELSGEFGGCPFIDKPATPADIDAALAGAWAMTAASAPE